jgi:hypothetical protein
MNGKPARPFWEAAASGLLGCTLFLWPFFVVALAPPDGTLGEAINNGAVAVLIAMWLACLFGIVIGRQV